MNYTFNQLQLFLKLVETGSVTKTAEEMHLTQPAVSIQLKNFQDQFDIPLTEVVGRKIYVTDFGKEIAETAKVVVDQLYAIQNRTHAYKEQLFGQLKISVVSTGKYVLPYFLSDFINQHPNIELKMDVSNKLKVLETLASNEVDFSLVSILPDNMKVEKIDLIENRLYLIGKKNPNMILNRNKVKSLESLPFIFREKGSGTRQMMEKFLSKYDIKLNKKIELTSNEAVKQAILAGLGYSIMPLIGIKNELREQSLEIIPIKGLPIRTTWSLVWLKGKKHSPVSSSFLKYLISEKNKIKNQYFDWYETT